MNQDFDIAGYSKSEDFVRLNRIEAKIDKLSDTVISLARAEEKLRVLDKDSEALFDQVKSLNARVDTLDKLAESTANTVRIINRITWIVVSLGVSAVAIQFLKVIGLTIE
jgi:hypothetical protein